MTLKQLIRWNRWRLESLDPEVQVQIEGQFQPDDGVERDATPSTTSTTTPGSEGPTLQWVAGPGGARRFASQIRSRHALQDIRPDVAALLSTTQRSVVLGRAPFVRWSWGDEEISGTVTRLTTRKTGLWPGTGLPQAVMFEIEITPSEDLPLDPILNEGETQHVRLRAGETFESLGQRYLGDPLRGDLIRRGNPQIEQDGAPVGRRVRVLESDHPDMVVPVVPSGIPFLDRLGRRDTWQPVVSELGTLRGSEDSPGLPFDLLPGVEAIDIDYGDP